ncbi:hypothetical protein evm_003701 [Chilo suppressalis]|nr:hypothetical protein evm_003701 [Chilo suppressalis]
MFKIVSTRKKGRVELSTVPASWENKGKLYFPKKNGELLCKNPAILPQPDWNTYNCTLKRNHFKTFEEAEEELSQMLNRTDTDDTDYEQQHDRRVNTSSRISQNKDFNSMAKNLIDSTASISPAAEHVVIEAQGMDGEIYTVIQNSQGTANTQQLSTAQVSYVNDQTTISNKLLLVVLQNQDKIMKKLGEISVQLEEIKENKKTFVTTLGEATGTQKEKIILEPVLYRLYLLGVYIQTACL